MALQKMALTHNARIKFILSTFKEIKRKQKKSMKKFSQNKFRYFTNLTLERSFHLVWLNYRFDLAFIYVLTAYHSPESLISGVEIVQGREWQSLLFYFCMKQTIDKVHWELEFPIFTTTQRPFKLFFYWILRVHTFLAVIKFRTQIDSQIYSRYSGTSIIRRADCSEK